MTTLLLRRTAAVGLVTAVVVAVAGAPPAHASPASRSGCLDGSAVLSVEEQRLPAAVPQQILRLSGFDRFAGQFAAVLCALPAPALAGPVVRAEGHLLWQSAVARAQGHGRPDGLPRADDRPLYWARLTMTAALRQWHPRFGITPAARADLLGVLDRASRGQDSVDFPAGRRVHRILVTGFDTFTLDFDIRQSNPSGANALALDGVTVHTPAGPARIEAVTFPVLWQPFEQGTVEHTLLPYLVPGPHQADLVTTTSMGRPGRFDLERWNGRYHFWIDNDNESRDSTIPIPAGVPTVLPPPEFVPTTLPYQQLTAASTGPFPVVDHTAVSEIPAGGTEVVQRPDGPTPGSTAVFGGGGNYLSNEVAYRATLLRDAVGAGIPVGHLHLPVLDFGPDNTTQVTDPVFEQNLRTILDQTRAILTVAAGMLR
jgi:hypothetical protein